VPERKGKESLKIIEMVTGRKGVAGFKELDYEGKKERGINAWLVSIVLYGQPDTNLTGSCQKYSGYSLEVDVGG